MSAQRVQRGKQARPAPRSRKRGEARTRGPLWRWLRLALLALLFLVVGTVALVLPWRWFPPPTTAFIFREGWQRGFSEVDYEWVPFGEISQHAALCVLAAEDQKFPAHHGFDVQSIQRALEERGKRLRGASTISQQLAKNLFLWPGRNLVRKGLEAYLTVAIENLYSKRRILELYLNTAEFGPGVFGVNAASRRFFGKRPSQLSLNEASRLAAVLPSPKRMSAARPSEYVRGRAGEIRKASRTLAPGTLRKLGWRR